MLFVLCVCVLLQALQQQQQAAAAVVAAQQAAVPAKRPAIDKSGVPVCCA